MKYLRAIVFAAALAAVPAIADPIVWHWSGAGPTLAPTGWPPPAQWLGESRQCTGMLSVSVRTETGGASWMQPFSALFGDASMPAFIRVLSPSPTAWINPQWAYGLVGQYQIQVGVGGLGVEIRTIGAGLWSATLHVDCSWYE